MREENKEGRMEEGEIKGEGGRYRKEGQGGFHKVMSH